MKKTFLLLFSAFILFACGSNTWEYEIVTIKPTKSSEKLADFVPNVFRINTDTLNALGSQGWELVGMYEKTETVHPNFGSEQYVSGLQPNVRTLEINFVFKRKK